MPLDKLPDTFALDTEVNLAGSRYVVVRAEPETKVEFAKTKRLTLRFRRVEMLDPKSILFSLPSICGAALPEVSVVRNPGDVVVLHEDDWRQCEFVASSHKEDISMELLGIHRIHSDEAAAVGWRKIHVRERIGQPLPTGTTWSQVAGLLGNFEHIAGVAIGARENTVAKAVGIRLPDGVVVWGVEEARGLSVLCVENLDGATAATAAALKRVADDLSCALVQWCPRRVYCRDVTIDHAAGTLLETAT
jgi:hypothetical protein